MNTVKVIVQGYTKEVTKGWLASSTVSLIKTPKYNIVVDPGVNKELLLSGLSKEELSPSDIDYIFLTHYHPDHILLTAVFDKATVLDSETIYDKDLETAYSGNIPETDVQVIKTPGHAYEHSSLLVNTGEGTVIIAGDVFWWFDSEPIDHSYEALINKEDPFVKDLEKLQESRKNLLSMAEWIIPGHGKMFKLPKKIEDVSM